jgi:hypothetical protein
MFRGIVTQGCSNDRCRESQREGVRVFAGLRAKYSGRIDGGSKANTECVLEGGGTKMM